MPNYWDNRAQEDLRYAAQNIASASLRIQFIYKRQYERLYQRIMAIYANIDAGNPPTRTDLWTYAQYREFLEELRVFSQSPEQISNEVKVAIEGTFIDVIGVGFGALPKVAVEAFVNTGEAARIANTNWSGQNYSSRIWQNTAALAVKLNDAVIDCVVGGKSLSKAADALAEKMGTAFYQAERILRTETAYVVGRAQEEKYKNAGVKRVRWVHGRHCDCEVCTERDGTIYPIDNHPTFPAHPNCTCTLSPVVEEESSVV